jgi:hypothetical protein
MKTTSEPVEPSERGNASHSFQAIQESCGHSRRVCWIGTPAMQLSGPERTASAPGKKREMDDSAANVEDTIRHQTSTRLITTLPDVWRWAIYVL